jgi:hypothetical protein
MISFPTDLCEPIFVHLGTQDLISLCLASHPFRLEAERVLYHTVNFPEDYFRALSWLNRISSEPSRLALAVRSLSLTGSVQSQIKLSTEDREDFQEKLSKILRLLLNLTELTIGDDGSGSHGVPLLQRSMLLGCPFRLNKLHILAGPHCFHNLDMTVPFLAEQHCIRELTIERIYLDLDLDLRSRFKLPVATLPNLAIARIPAFALVDVLAPRPIERLYVEHCWNVHDYDIISFKLFSRTLTHLRFGSLALPEALKKSLFTCFPELRFLHLDINPPVSFRTFESYIF